MKSANQKAKLLYIYRFLFEESDFEHPVTVKQIIEHLNRCGIKSERKSIYSDLETLSDFGVDIEKRKAKTTGYFIGERLFQYAELVLLADAVQSSKFITQKKSNELAVKLKTLMSRKEASSLNRNFLVQNRVKAMNECIYYNVDAIERAIENHETITFKYFYYDRNKQKVYRHHGALYKVTPIKTLWNEDNVYLAAFDEAEKIKKHFRVDKMEKITVCEKSTYDYEKNQDDNATLFGMFGGECENVTLRCLNELSGVIIDRFGKDTVFRNVGDDKFEVTVKVEISPVFLSWVMSFGNRIKIESPERVKKEYTDLLRSSLKQYQEVLK